MSVRMSFGEILTVIKFCVSGLPKEDLVNVTRIGKCQDKCQDECQDVCHDDCQDECQGGCQGNTDRYADTCTVLCVRIT